MPAELFRSVVVRRAAAGHRLTAVPLSVALHALVIAAVVVVLLVATNDVLPVARMAVESWVPPSMPVVPVPQVPPRRSMQPMRAHWDDAGGAPVTPPNGIGPEIARPVDPERNPLTSDDMIFGPPGAIDSFVPEPSPRPEPSKPVRPVRVSDVRSPVRVHYEPPVYPQLAIMTHVEGTVTIEAIISATGTVEDARVLSSVRLLDAAALAAVRQWVYRPTLLNGVPVPVIMTVKVEFRLR